MSVLNFIRRLAGLVLAAAGLAAMAHGDEPHGDAPHAVPAASSPRFEAASEAFELVGRIEEGELLIFIHRFETNEPVSQATVELEAGEQQAVAEYQPEQGRYAVREPAFVQALSRAGSHSLVITVTAGSDADLLEATLEVAASRLADHSHAPTALVTALASMAVLAALGLAVFMMRRAGARRRAQR